MSDDNIVKIKYKGVVIGFKVWFDSGAEERLFDYLRSLGVEFDTDVEAWNTPDIIVENVIGLDFIFNNQKVYKD